MPPIQQITANLKAKIATRRGTPEQIERARRNAMQANYNCRPDCPICGGIGYVQDEFGKVNACPNVSSLMLFPGERYGLSLSERGLTWEQVSPVNGVETALAQVRQALERGAGFVYLWGPPGLAKTLLLKTAVALSLEAHQAAAYTRMVEILDDMRAAFDARDPSGESQRRLDWWAGLPVLAIDEFDRLRETEYAAERRFLLMDRRYESALRGGHGMPCFGAAERGGYNAAERGGAGEPAFGATGRGGYNAAGRGGTGKPAFGATGRGGYNATGRGGTVGAVTLMAANEDPALLDGYLYDRIRDGRFCVVHLSGDSLRPAMEWE